jgi:hypothetical protein
MNYNLTITPKSGEHKDFKYILTITNTSQTILGSRSARYSSLAPIMSALSKAGWPGLANDAVTELASGRPFSNTLAISDSQMDTLLKRD